MSDSMSRLERYLRESGKINVIRRRRMIAEYTREGDMPTLKNMVEEAHEEGLMDDRTYADLSVLVLNEDADLNEVVTMNGDLLTPALIARDLELAMETAEWNAAIGYDAQEDGSVHTTVYDRLGNIVATAKVRIVIESVERIVAGPAPKEDATTEAGRGW